MQGRFSSKPFFQSPAFAAKICAIGLIAVLSLRMLISVWLHPLRIGWDPALHLQCAQLIVAGGLPYVDMFDVNPPLIWYLDTVPAITASLLNMPVTLAFNLFMLALMMLSASLCALIVLNKLPKSDLIVNLALIFGLLYFNFFLGFDFGQREQIFVLLYAPFMFLRFARYQGAVVGRREAVLVGLLAGVGICLKHYFLFNAVCIELFLLFHFKSHLKELLRNRIFVAENWAAFTFALIYLAHFLFLPQIVKDNYFGFLVPAFARGYQFWDTSLAASLAAPDKRTVFLLLAGGLILALSYCRRYQLLACVAAFALSGVVPYLMQFKGWNYQDIPAFAGAVILLCGGAAALISSVIQFAFKLRSEQQLPIVTIITLLLTAGLSCASAAEEFHQVETNTKFDMERIGYSGNSPWADIDSPFTKIMLDNAKFSDPVIFISNAVAPGFPPLTQLRMTPGSRHLHCCILSVLQYIQDVSDSSPECTRLLSYQQKIADQYAEDIAKNKPVLIFMQNAPSAEYLAPFAFDKNFKNYKKIEEDIVGFSVYKLQPSAKVVP